MASLSDLVSVGSLKPMGVLATVDRAPSDADDTLDVLYTTDAGSDADEKALRWASRGGVLPAEGDDVLLFLDSLGDPWGIVWPSGATSDVSGSLAAIDARLDALEARRQVDGRVSAAGGVIAGGSGDWSAVRNAAGDYTVTFATAFAAAPTVVPSAGSTAGNLYAKISQTSAPTTTGFGVYTVRADTGALTDSEFGFIARGRR
jgi:hypothetical protein